MTQFNSNFARTQELVGGGVDLAGNTDPVDGAELVTRAVALLQGDAFGHSMVPGIGRWTGASVQGPFETGPATAIGTETYLVGPSEDRTPAFVTFSWTQIVTIV